MSASSWWQANARAIIAVGIFGATGLCGVRAELYRAIGKKADHASIVRELDHVRQELRDLNHKMDEILLRDKTISAGDGRRYNDS